MRLFARPDDARIEDMARDPQFLFRVGRLLGATELAGHMLVQHQEENARNLGRILLDRLQWFPSDDPRIPSSREADTLVVKP